MGHIKDVLIDAEQALDRHTLQPSEDEREIAFQAAVRARLSVSDSYDDLRKGREVALQHRELRDVLMSLHGVKPSGTKAFNARLKHILDQDLVDDRREDGRGRRTYNLVDVLEISLCLQLQRSYVPPTAAVRFVRENREFLDELWMQGRKGMPPRLNLEVDAFAAIGDVSRANGKGSRGNETNTISIDRLAHLRPGAIPPSVLSIDTGDLQRRVENEIIQAAANEAVRAGILYRRSEPSRTTFGMERWLEPDNF